jgi:hypothetical protein
VPTSVAKAARIWRRGILIAALDESEIWEEEGRGGRRGGIEPVDQQQKVMESCAVIA